MRFEDDLVESSTWGNSTLRNADLEMGCCLLKEGDDDYWTSDYSVCFGYPLRTYLVVFLGRPLPPLKALTVVLFALIHAANRFPQDLH